MHPSVLRHFHAARVFHAIRLRPRMSQRDIGRVTGADKSTVSSIIKDFEAAGLIERTVQPASNRPGRPGERISISTRGWVLVGVHPRVDEIRYVAASLSGETIAVVARDLPDAGSLGAEVDAGIRAVVGKAGRDESAIRAVGFSAPGLVSRDGLLAQSPNLGWSDVPLRSLLAGAVPYPLYIDNNANAATVAEYMFGRGIDVGDFAYVESGSGVGCGLFLDGGIYRGSRGFAGEFGHTKIVPQGRLCRCGNLGCLSAYVSDISLYQRLLGAGVRCATREEVVAHAESGHGVVRDVLDEAGRHLGAGLANLVNLLDLSLFILGGGLEVFAPYMMAGIETALKNLALPSALAGCRIESSKIGSLPEPRGGVALALEGCTSFRDSGSSPWGSSRKASCP